MTIPDIIIAVDGYSSTGKSTFARLVAAEFGFLYLDSGAMYRGVTLAGLEAGVIGDGKIDEAGVKGIISFGMGLTLREGDREYYYAALDRHFPGLKEEYIRTYGNAYEVPSPRAKELMDLFRSFCRKHEMMYRPEECFDYMNRLPEKFEQISFLDV